MLASEVVTTRRPWGYFGALGLTAGLFVLSAIAISWLSLTRQDFFQQHLENMPSSAYLWLAFWLSSYLLAWSLLVMIKPVIGHRGLIIVASIIFAISLVTPPLLSRDAVAYALNADILYHSQLNPYKVPIGLGRQADQIRPLWWLDSSSPYGPIFLLIVFLPWLAAAAQLLPFIFFYKLLVLAAFLALFYLFRRIRQAIGQPVYLDWLFLLNPALIINWLLEGHNDAFIALALLGLVYSGRRFMPALAAGLSAVFIKLTALIIWPLVWFKDNKFNWSRFIVSNLILAVAWSLFFWLIRLTPLAFWQHHNIAFASSHCFYTCSPFFIVSGLLPSSLAVVIGPTFFILAYLASVYFFLFKKYQPLKFIV